MKIRKVFVVFLVLVVMGPLIYDEMILSITASPSSLRKETPETQKTKEKMLIQTASSEGALETFQRDATIMLLETWKNNYNIVPRNQELQFLFKRPTDPIGGIDDNQHLLPQLYNTTHFILHWTNGSDGGLPADAVPLNDTNENGIPDYIENFGEIFENVWNFEVVIRGFLAPPNDLSEPNDPNSRNPDGRYDIFIYDMQYYGYAYPEQWPESPSCSYIAVDNDYNGFPTPQLEAMQVTAAHEFFHAIQFVYDCTEEMWWMETTATYMEDEVYPEVNDNYQYLPSWFQMSDTYGLESTEGLHEYGNFIFAKHLSENFGDEIIKEIWEEMVNTNGLIAIENVLVGRNSTTIDEFSKFTTANFFLEDMYVDGADYRDFITGETTFNGVWLEYQYDASTAPNFLEINRTNVNYDAWMDKWATDYITMKLDPTKSNYGVLFDGLDLSTNYLVKLVIKKEGNITERVFDLDSQQDGYVNLAYDTFDNVTLIIANAGNTNTTNPSWRVIITTHSEVEEIHDLAVLGVTPSATSIRRGEFVWINVTVTNQGSVAETFDVETYGNTTVIQTKTVTLENNASVILTFIWNTTEFTNGSYTIRAYVWPVEGEIDTADNEYTDGVVSLVEYVIDYSIEGPYYIFLGIEYWIITFVGNHPIRLVANC